MCVCVFIKLHITAQSGPVILLIVFLCYSIPGISTACNPPRGLLLVNIFMARNARAYGVCVCIFMKLNMTVCVCIY